MASRGSADKRPDVGDILVVIHDFLARSSDELSLAKGDRVELIERDDEFGDGWFLGKHLANGNSGLFPEVYTRPAPRPAGSSLPKPATPSQGTASAQGRPTTPQTASQADDEPTSPFTLPLNSTKPESQPGSVPPAPLASKSFNYGGGMEGLGRLQSGPSQDIPVLHETLTVIDEHITDLHSTPQNGTLHNATDSGSEYSSQMQDRLSYIQGEETDEEEDAPHTRAEVEAWTADNVAEYLFTAGVEKKHCEVFRDQEIAGEVLLGMDQSSLFLKAFDLGSVGRRLKTWQKIKALQDEVNGLGIETRRQTYESDGASEDSRAHGRFRSRTNTLTNSQRLPPIEDRPGSVQGRRLSQTPKMEPMSPKSPVSPNALQDSPSRTHTRRPSAASVRDLHHSRRHSSTDYRLAGGVPGSAGAGTPKLSAAGTFPLTDRSHKKQPSFDRNWTMGGAAPGPHPARPLSSAGIQDVVNGSHLEVSHDSTLDYERGYFSGTELDGRKRNVLKKRDSIASHSHSHKSSYTEQQRVRSATALSRRSRFGSVDSSRDSMPPAAAQAYYGTSAGDHRRTASTATTESYRPPPPAKDGPPPTVTKLDEDGSPKSTTHRPALHGDWFSNASGKLAGFGGLRAISDAVVGNDRLKVGSMDASMKDSSLPSPVRPGSSTPSAGPSFELDSPDLQKSPYSSTTVNSRKSAAKKTKKETSAYLRGLQKIGPREAIQDAEYSGWMKKKSSHLMTTWKPRLFVLKGRRLSYYYSEDDTEEKGLIDISFHRVLPADNERLTGLHATLTGASNTPTTPADSNLQTVADSDGAAMAAIEKGADSMFIFKLMPPRAGLSKAVNFTKPTVHYFAVPNVQQGRAWMAALMKATIDRDDSKPMTSTYQQKTISLTKARAMRHRPPALMGLEEKADGTKGGDDKNGLGISFGEVDSAVSGLEKLNGQKTESATVNRSTFNNEKGEGEVPSFLSPQSA
ncbi:hypothetical protein F4780DRAFT_110720 [Xylariomycetidae sp. FL0641]|nr:hypothetical protein F4780DRAFT_110720 [Xylariomycetidae sp. FL0641]